MNSDKTLHMLSHPPISKSNQNYSKLNNFDSYVHYSTKLYNEFNFSKLYLFNDYVELKISNFNNLCVNYLRSVILCT